MNEEFPTSESQELMERLNRAIPPHTTALPEHDSDPQVMAARRLARGPRPLLSETASSRIEAQLRARTRELYPQHHTHPTRVRKIRHWVWRYALAACLIIAILMFGTVQVSASSLPGDRLYSVKRAVENGRLAIVSNAGEPELRTDLAQRRIDEFRLLLARNRVYPPVLQEASDQLNLTLDLLAAGYGDAAVLYRRVFTLAQQQINLIEESAILASPSEWQQLQQLAGRSVVIQTEAVSGQAVYGIPGQALPPVVQPTIPVSDTPLPVMVESPAEVFALSATPTVFSSATPIPGQPTAVKTKVKPQDQAKDDGAPSRTPPGHGPTPGLGNNPPGQGGQNPGQGNNNNPPGQDKPDKPDKPK